MTESITVTHPYFINGIIFTWHGSHHFTKRSRRLSATMNKLIKIAFSISLLFAAQAALACDYPNRVLVPNGNTATTEEMVAGQRGIRKYVADMEIYLECIVEEENAARDSIGDMEADVEQ